MTNHQFSIAVTCIFIGRTCVYLWFIFIFLSISLTISLFLSQLFLIIRQSYHTLNSQFLHFSLNTITEYVTFLTMPSNQMFLVNPSRYHNICSSQLQVFQLSVTHPCSYLSNLHKDFCTVTSHLIFICCESLFNSILFSMEQFLNLNDFSQLNFALLS